MNRTTPLATPDISIDVPETEGARFEAPLHTLPYPLRDARGACVDTRDLLQDEEPTPY